MSMSMVAASGAMPRFERLYSPSPSDEAVGRSEPRGRVERSDRDDDDGARRMRRDDDGPGRRNPLVGALMQALQGLMASRPAGNAPPAPAAGPVAAPTSAAATPAANPRDTDASAATVGSATAASDPADLKDVAVAFAHELFSALRSVGGEDGYRGRGHHHHHHHGHGHGYGRGGNDYGGLAQGLRDLARSISMPNSGSVPATTPAAPAAPAPTPAATAPAPAAAPVALPVIATAPAPQTDAPAPVGDAPAADAVSPLAAAPAGSSIEININIQIKFNMPAPAAAAPAAPAAKPDSPLLAAFKRLMEQLNPTASAPATPGATGAAGDADSPEAKLKAFLLGIADALGGSPSGSTPGTGSDSRAPVGSLISIAA